MANKIKLFGFKINVKVVKIKQNMLPVSKAYVEKEFLYPIPLNSSILYLIRIFYYYD